MSLREEAISVDSKKEEFRQAVARAKELEVIETLVYML